MLENCLRLAARAALAAALLAGATAHAQDRSKWPKSIKVGTASQGGTYFIYGAGWANLVQQQLGVNATAEVTGGPTQNMALVNGKQLEFGMITSGPGFDAWSGKSEIAPGVEMKDVRAMFPMYQTPFQIITLKRSNISKVEDLKGKRVGVGPRGGTAGAYWPQFFEAVGVKINPQYGGASDQASQVQDGIIDAFAFAAGIPISAFTQLEAQIPVNIFSFDEKQLDQVLKKFPSASKFVVPADTYRSINKDQATLSMWNFAITHKDMPEDLVYEIMKVVLDNPERMKQVHQSAEETLAKNMEHNRFMWFHPGAIRYYKEKGLKVADDLVPPEMKKK